MSASEPPTVAVNSDASQSAPTTRRFDAVASRSAREANRRAAAQHYGQRNSELRRLGYANYRTYLSSKHWRELRAEFRASDLPQECICGDTETYLHHLTYERIGAERLSDLTPLCGRCHSLVHVLEWGGHLSINLEGLTDLERAEIGRAWLAEQVAERQRESAERAAAERAEVLAMTFPARLSKAVQVAKYRRVDVSHRLHILKRYAARKAPDATLTKHLRVIESAAYGWDDWL